MLASIFVLASFGNAEFLDGSVDASFQSTRLERAQRALEEEDLIAMESAEAGEADALALGPQLGTGRANKLLRMRFFIWNSKQPFQPNSKETIEITADKWHKKRLTYGAEVIDPLKNEKSKIFDPTLKTQFQIHGFGAHIPLGGLNLIMQAHTKRGDFDDYNFIGLDWRDLAAHQLPGDGYDTPANNVYYAGVRAAEMLLAMIGSGSDNGLEKFHVIGHSLGCHVAGNMGRTLTAKLGGRKLTHITALEPAGPKFVDDSDSKIALRKTDATYIDAVHTDGAINKPFVIRGKLGDARPDMAHANFYINGGQTQPGCKASFGLCSHQRSFKYYAESVSNRQAFKGFRCELTEAIRKGVPTWHKLGNDGCLKMKISDSSQTTYLTDEYADNKPMGLYVVKTYSKYPYTDPAWNAQQ